MALPSLLLKAGGQLGQPVCCYLYLYGDHGKMLG
jgi:hypothetical protein